MNNRAAARPNTTDGRYSHSPYNKPDNSKVFTKSLSTHGKTLFEIMPVYATVELLLLLEFPLCVRELDHRTVYLPPIETLM